VISDRKSAKFVYPGLTFALRVLFYSMLFNKKTPDDELRVPGMMSVKSGKFRWYP